MHDQEKRSFWKVPVVILLALAALYTPYDIWYVATRHHEGWWPFFIPAVCLIGALAMRHYGRIIDAAPPEAVERLRREMQKESFLDPNNIPPDKRNPPPGTIG